MHRATHLLLAAALLAPAAAAGHDPYYGYGYRYGYGYGYPYHSSPRTEAELARIRGELRQQRRRADAQERERGAELDVLRQQLNTRYQVDAAQACYYRSVGGLEICADLFEAGSDDRARCEALVAERNPGC